MPNRSMTGLAAAKVSSSRLLASGIVETTLTGRAVGSTIVDIATDYRSLGRAGRPWLIRAEETTSYAPEAVTQAVTSFSELCAQHGLTRLVAVIKTPTVRMGAQVVSMSLRAAGSPLEILVVDSVEDAQRLLEGGPLEKA